MDSNGFDKIKENFSENLRLYRKMKGLTQAELGEQAGMSTTIISDYENKNKTPNLKAIWNLSKVLGVTLDQLCAIDPDEQLQVSMKHEFCLTALAFINQCKAQVHVQDNIIQLKILQKNDNQEYSSYNILEFFKDYEIIQSINKPPIKEEMIEALLSDLRKKYNYLPNLPDYKEMEKREKSKKKVKNKKLENNNTAEN